MNIYSPFIIRCPNNKICQYIHRIRLYCLIKKFVFFPLYIALEIPKNKLSYFLLRIEFPGIEETKNGRKFQFGPTRDQNKSIRILDQNGNEQFLATICFFDEEE